MKKRKKSLNFYFILIKKISHCDFSGMTQVTVSSPPVTSMRLMSCVRESSPPIEPVPPPEIVRHGKKALFPPLLNFKFTLPKTLREIFLCHVGSFIFFL